MSNWVINKVTFETKDKELLDKILTTVKGKSEEYGGIDFETIIPMPDDIFRGPIGDKEQKLYGSKNWYDWSWENWGTKWNACDCESQAKGSNRLEFQTAWAAPHPVIKRVSEMFPDVAIIHKWADEDMGYNCGIKVYKAGDVKFERDESLMFACDLWNQDYDECIKQWLEDII